MEAVGSPGSSESPLSTLLFPTQSQQKTRIKKFSQAWEKKSTTKKADKKVLLSHLVCTLWGMKNEAKPLFPRTELFISPRSERSERRGLCIFVRGVSGYYGGWVSGYYGGWVSGYYGKWLSGYCDCICYRTPCPKSGGSGDTFWGNWLLLFLMMFHHKGMVKSS